MLVEVVKAVSYCEMGFFELRWKVVAPGMIGTADNTCGELGELVEVWDVHVYMFCVL